MVYYIYKTETFENKKYKLDELQLDMPRKKIVYIDINEIEKFEIPKTKDTIKLTTMVSNVVDREMQEKIDVVKQRLIKNYGYNEESATDVLNFVASIFARGDVKRD